MTLLFSDLTATANGTQAPTVIPFVSSDEIERKSIMCLTDVKVLHVVNGEYFSGAERVQSHLGRCLPEFAVTADFASIKPGTFAEMVEEQGGKWGNGYRTGMKHRFDLSAAWHIRELVKSNGYDLLHAHTPRSAMITAVVSKLTGVPWIYHVHSPAARVYQRFARQDRPSLSPAGDG